MIVNSIYSCNISLAILSRLLLVYFYILIDCKISASILKIKL